MKKQKGITIIALIITIIVLLIIAGIAISALMSEDGLINMALKAAFVEELTRIDENIQIELTGNVIKVYNGESEEIVFNDSLKVNESDIPFTMLTELEGLEGNTDNLYWVPVRLADGKERTYMYETKIKVVFKQKGLTIYGKTIHSVKGATLEDELEESPNIATMEVSTKYGYYEPDLNGFDVNNTYIVYYSSDYSKYYDEMTLKEYLELGRPQTHDLIVNGEMVTYYFHNYNEDKTKSTWGNVITKANGLEAWWVWIPRYAYEIDNNQKTVDAVFINISNDSLNESKQFNGNNMGNYIPHSGFDLKGGKTKLKGIWMAKYEASISNMGNESLDNGSLKYYKPNLKGYNINSTYIATYNISGESSGKQYLLKDILLNDYVAETDGTLISGTVDETKFGSTDEYWYNYSNKIWGNIVTKANGLEAWWVWIPRYAYVLGEGDKNVDILFITTQNKLFDGNRNLGMYKPHPAFTLKDGTELEGIWMAKYEAAINENGNHETENGEKKYYIPKLVGYNINSTYIVTYNEAGELTGNEYLLKNILKDGYQVDGKGVLTSGIVDENKFSSSTEIWYDYDKKIWGNIITRANDLEAWWVWIPRYAYVLGEGDKNVDVVFITTENKVFNGNNNLGIYTPHSGFTLKDGTELEGIWMAKYEASGTFTAEDENINN